MAVRRGLGQFEQSLHSLRGDIYVPLSRPAVLRLIAEYDRIGLPKFLERYAPRGGARSRFLVHNGKFYNMKAIWRGAVGDNLPAGEHSDRAQRDLQTIGFVCVKDAQQQRHDFESQLSAAQKRSTEQRRRRLASAPKIPKKITVLTTVFVRNPDVIIETLALAEGKCGACKKTAPFLTKKDKRPYLEVHHKHQLADGGEDSVENAIALCPNCHLRAHLG